MKRNGEKTLIVIVSGLASVIFALALLVGSIYEIGHWQGRW